MMLVDPQSVGQHMGIFSLGDAHDIPPFSSQWAGLCSIDFP